MKMIVKYPDPILRKKTKQVKQVTKKLLLEMIDLEKTLDVAENGAGLAAVQIGLNERFFGIKDVKTKETVIIINPKITKTFGKLEYPIIVGDGGREEDFLEGCLSFPDYYGTVKRFIKVEAKWQEIIEGKLVDKKLELSGFEAIVFQHELDHLNGIVFVDHVKEEGGKFYKQLGKEMVKWSVDKVIKGDL